MKTKKEVIVIGDIEMGGGTLTDDFISDRTLAKLIVSLSKRTHPVDLILNGDTFDFLKCPYIVNNKVTYPRHITSEISLAKLRQIYNTHTKVFEALKQFVSKEGNQLIFVIGNHDPDLVHKDVQLAIKNYLNNKKKIFFKFQYNKHSIHAEHGHQYDFINKVNVNQLFLNYKKEKILNIPWVSFGIISRFLSLKEEFPFLERIAPRPLIFTNHESAFKKMNFRAFEYFMKGAFYYPIRYFYDPTHTFPKELLREFYRRFKKVHWDVDNIVDVFKRKKKDLGKSKIYVLGHVHKRYVEEIGSYRIIHTDTWRDEYFMDSKTRELVPKSKKYLQVLIDEEDHLEWKLVESPTNRTTLHFDDVIRDEKKFIALAAKEEGFITSRQ